MTTTHRIQTGQEEVVAARIAETLERIEQLCSPSPEMTSFQDLEAFEKELATLTGELEALVLQKQLQAVLDSEAFRRQEAAWIDQLPGRWVSEGYREVRVRCARGGDVVVRMRYFRRKGRSVKLKRKGHYPALVVLGITHGCTPHLGSLAGTLAAAVGSLQEACEALRRWGVTIDLKTLRALAYGWAERARALQTHSGGIDYANHLSERCVVVSTDGGRVRICRDKRGPRTKKGRRRDHSGWREPKVLVIYTVDADGRRSREVAPLIDATLHGPEMVMAPLCHYLGHLQVQRADKLLFIADAAVWIRKRVDAPIERLGIVAERVYQLVRSAKLCLAN
jgi:hypothetical protein